MAVICKCTPPRSCPVASRSLKLELTPHLWARHLLNSSFIVPRVDFTLRSIWRSHSTRFGLLNQVRALDPQTCKPCFVLDEMSPALRATAARQNRAIVVGAGIAGLSATVALRRAGWDVTVLERSRFKNEIGAAITVPPNATMVLDRWGFDAEVSCGHS